MVVTTFCFGIDAVGAIETANADLPDVRLIDGEYRPLRVC